MYKVGYKRYQSFPNPEPPVLVPTSHSVSEVKSPADVIMDKIFCKDVNGWPQPSLSVYLGEKTPADIKQFIEQNILVLDGENHSIQDENIVAEFRKLESGFIAEASRNRFESIEDYEARLQYLINEDSKQEAFKSYQKRAAELWKKFDDTKNLSTIESK